MKKENPAGTRFGDAGRDGSSPPKGAYKLCTHKNRYVHTHARARTTHGRRQPRSTVQSFVGCKDLHRVPVHARKEGRIRVSVEVAQLLPEPLFSEVFCVPYFKDLFGGKQKKMVST